MYENEKDQVLTQCDGLAHDVSMIIDGRGSLDELRMFISTMDGAGIEADKDLESALDLANNLFEKIKAITKKIENVSVIDYPPDEDEDAEDWNHAVNSYRGGDLGCDNGLSYDERGGWRC